LPIWLKIQKAACGRAFIKVEKNQAGRKRQVVLFIMLLDSLDKFKNLTHSISKTTYQTNDFI
jgi:hypothetical protein